MTWPAHINIVCANMRLNFCTRVPHTDLWLNLCIYLHYLGQLILDLTSNAMSACTPTFTLNTWDRDETD